MVTKCRAVFIGVIIAALSGCGTPHRYEDRPFPTRFDKIEQPQLQSAAHWQIIADNFAQDLAADLKQRGLNAPLVIPSDRGGFAFVEGFTELLTTSLVAQGLDVRTCAQRTCGGANAANSEMMPRAVLDVRYSAYAFQPKDIYYTGELTTLTAGLFAVGGIVSGGASMEPARRAVSYAGKVLGVALLGDAAFWASHSANTGPDGKYMRHVPKTEILLTASITLDDRIVVRRSNVYFTSDEDAALYWRGAASKTLPVKGE